MKIPFFTIIGVLSLVMADSPNDLRASVRYPISHDPAMNCLSEIDPFPFDRWDDASSWCTNTTFLNRLNHCTRDACSPTAADVLNIFQSWCAESSVPLPSDQFSCSISEHSTNPNELERGNLIKQPSSHNRFVTRSSSNPYDSGISQPAMIGIVFGIIVTFAFCVLLLCGCAETSKHKARVARIAALPVSEPRRGRVTNSPPIQLSARARTPTPPPPYVPAPEAAHVKDGPEEPQPPLYEDRAGGGNVRM